MSDESAAGIGLRPRRRYRSRSRHPVVRMLISIADWAVAEYACRDRGFVGLMGKIDLIEKGAAGEDNSAAFPFPAVGGLYVAPLFLCTC